jgi:hypothetical protein
VSGPHRSASLPLPCSDRPRDMAAPPAPTGSGPLPIGCCRPRLHRGPPPLPLSTWRRVIPATPPFLSPPARKESPEAPIFTVFFPHPSPPFHSARERNTFSSYPLDLLSATGDPHQISPKRRRHPPLTVRACRRPLLCIRWHASPFPPSTLPTGAARRPLELTENRATVRTPLAATAKPLLRSSHHHPSSPVRTHPRKNVRNHLLFALMLVVPCPRPLIGWCTTAGHASMTVVTAVTARSRVPRASCAADRTGRYWPWA